MANPDVYSTAAIVQNAPAVLVFKGCGKVSIQAGPYVVFGPAGLDPTDASTQFPAAFLDATSTFKVNVFDAEVEIYAASMQPSPGAVKVTRWF
jgi:hypothetical protein